MPEIFCEDANYLHLIFDMQGPVQVTFLSLFGFARDCCSLTLRKLKVGLRETFFVVKVMHASCITLIMHFVSLARCLGFTSLVCCLALIQM